MRAGIAAVLRAFEDGRDRAEFYRGWRAGLSAGLTHPATLGTMRAPRGVVGAVHAHLLAGTAAGRGVAELVRQRPALFEPFEAALLSVGEESGRLEPVLAALADFHQRQHRMMLAIRKRLAYPLFVSFVAVLILPLPLVFRGEVRAYWAATALGLLAWLFLGGAVLARRAQAYQRRPGFVRARLARTLAMAIEAGLPLGRAVPLAAAASGSPALAAHVRRLGERRLAGQPLVETFRDAPMMTPEFLSSLDVAERTGDVSSTLGRLAELYEDGFS